MPKISTFFLMTCLSLLAAPPIEFDLMHTRPECNHSGRPVTWCKSEDAASIAKASGMESAVTEQLDEATDPEKSRVSIGYFSFSNTTVFNKLCELGKNGIRIDGFFDSSYAGDSAAPGRLASQCQGPSGKNVKIYFLGKKSPWRLHHNKFLLVDSGHGKLHLNFSSGNLSVYGLSIHFDHWVMLKANRNSQVIQHHLCLVEALKKAVNDKELTPEQDNPKVYRTTLDACLEKNTEWSENPSWVEDAIGTEEIAPLFSPDPKNNIYNVLAKNIDDVVAGGKIYGAMQHFLHQQIAGKLKKAQERGVEIHLLMDDDVVRGDSEVPGVSTFYRNFLQPSVSGFEMGFMQTNSNAGGGKAQMMHNKFVVLEGVKKKGTTRVFSGAGHFTNAGMQNNYENFYLSENEDLTEKYEELFDFMNKYAVDEKTANQ